jgi:hypothetical protein
VPPEQCENRENAGKMRSKSSDLARELAAILSAARAEFMAALPQRIALIDGLLSDLEGGGAPDPARDTQAALVALRSEMHRIAGLCGSIGLEGLSRSGTAAEEVLRPFATARDTPGDPAALAPAIAAVHEVRAGLLRLDWQQARGEV